MKCSIIIEQFLQTDWGQSQAPIDSLRIDAILNCTLTSGKVHYSKKNPSTGWSKGAKLQTGSSHLITL